MLDHVRTDCRVDCGDGGDASAARVCGTWLDGSETKPVKKTNSYSTFDRKR